MLADALKRYVRIHRTMFVDFYREAFLLLKPRAFVRAINLYCWIRRKKVRFNYDAKVGRYSYRDLSDGVEIVFYHKKRAWLYINGIRHRAYALANSYMLQRVRIESGDRVIDCGANIGELYRWFGFEGVKVDYNAFEPSPLEFEALRQNCPAATCHNKALWFENKTLAFYLASEEADSSLIQPGQYDKVVQVDAVRLDSFIDKPVRLLKLEAEGAEPEILQGLGTKLEYIDYIAADLGCERGVKGESTLAPVVRYLYERDFELVDASFPRITALFRNKRPLGRSSADASAKTEIE